MVIVLAGRKLALVTGWFHVLIGYMKVYSVL